MCCKCEFYHIGHTIADNQLIEVCKADLEALFFLFLCVLWQAVSSVELMWMRMSSQVESTTSIQFILINKCFTNVLFHVVYFFKGLTTFCHDH